MEWNDKLPVYQQMKDYFIDAILAGTYPLGSELPSRRAIASEFKVNPNTVQRAFKAMEEEGVIVTLANVPSQVTQDQVLLNRLRRQRLRQAIEQFYRQVQALNDDEKVMFQALEDYVEEEASHD